MPEKDGSFSTEPPISVIIGQSLTSFDRLTFLKDLETKVARAKIVIILRQKARNSRFIYRLFVSSCHCRCIESHVQFKMYSTVYPVQLFLDKILNSSCIKSVP